MVYMENDSHKKEYVLNEAGRLYCGSARRFGGRPWDHGQVNHYRSMLRPLRGKTSLSKCPFILFVICSTICDYIRDCFYPWIQNMYHLVPEKI